eukprot:m.164117 g.164117  ORF g.164117 m.164117 type:complete len:317 (-) comp18111_c0_seq50:393-1343(-)
MLQLWHASLAMCNYSGMKVGCDEVVRIADDHVPSKVRPAESDGVVDEYGIDLSRPILDQVGTLGIKYDEWVHKPSMRPTFRMFRFTLCETFAATSWWVIPVLWIPVALFLARLSLELEMSRVVDPGFDDVSVSGHMNATSRDSTAVLTVYTSFGIWFLIGLTIWSIFEYGLHRFLFHHKMNTSSEFLIRWHYVLHGQHHKFPLDKGRLVFPPVAATIAACIVYFGLLSPMIPDTAQRLAAMSGFTVGYISYDMLHYYVHHGHPSQQYFRKLKESHMRHHYKDAAHGFGISSKFWDTIFGSAHPDTNDTNENKEKSS